MEQDSWSQLFTGKISSILLFGPPGSGKGTLGKFLSGAGTQYHLASGEIFKNLSSDPAAGNLHESYINGGKLIPDDAAVEMWKTYVEDLIAKKAFCPESQDLLLDGIPRTLAQAMLLQNYITVRHIIVLEIFNKSELSTRMQKKAKIEGKTQDAGLDVFRKGIENYEKEIQAIIDFYPHHLVSRVNADQRPLEVLRDVLTRLSHVLSRGPKKGAS